jgi:magnesium transporter
LGLITNDCYFKKQKLQLKEAAEQEMIHKIRRKNKIGLPPGTLVYTGLKKLDKSRIEIFQFNEHKIEIVEEQSIENLQQYKDTPETTWIHVKGLHDPQLIEQIGEQYDIHPLVLEDILSTGQRPKIEYFEDFVFIVAHMLRYDNSHQEVVVEQVSIILRPHEVLTFVDSDLDVFDPVRERLKAGRVRIRKSGTDYLVYAILDVLVDHYFVLLEILSEKLEHLEAQVLEDTEDGIVQKIYRVKQQVVALRKSVWPLREVMQAILRQESTLLKKSTLRFFGDLNDHVNQVMDAVDTYRELSTIIMDIHFSIVSNHMNQVMKVLTIIATIFIPLSFLAGVYGMNFDTSLPGNMPELGQPYGYVVFWTICLAVGFGLLIYFRKKRWL